MVLLSVSTWSAYECWALSEVTGNWFYLGCLIQQRGGEAMNEGLPLSCLLTGFPPVQVSGFTKW